MKEKYYTRYITEKIKERFKNNQIIILIGSRQVGKTHIIKHYLEAYPEKTKKYFYFDFEHSADLEAWQGIEYLEHYLSQHHASLTDSLFFAIDEFQYLKNATKLFKLIYDRYPHIQILATGSSSLEIQKHLKESLSGRKKVYSVYPLSFKEYLMALGKEGLLKNTHDTATLSSCFQHYLLWGGYPRLTERYKGSAEEKKEELNDIYTSYIQKDIKGIIKGENILAFNNLVKLLATQVGNLLNISELSATLKMTRYDIEKYLAILEETFVIKRVPAYFSNKRKEITKMPKIYFSDTGMMNMALSHFGPISTRVNAGAIIENYVYNQLRHFMSITDKLYFWRTLEGVEVDFIWQKDNEIIPIEVKWSHFKEPFIPVSLKHFCGKFSGVKEAWIITKDFFGSKEEAGVRYLFIPTFFITNYMESSK